VLDSVACITLRQIPQVVSLRGAVTVAVRLTPDVAFAMARLGVDLGNVRTAADVDEGLHLLHVHFGDLGA
jgi:rsbT antagonist protein RsbS